MKHTILLFFWFLVYLNSQWVNALRDAIIPTNQDLIDDGSSWTQLLDYVLWSLRDFIFAILIVISVGMFLYIGWRLIVARWNPEEFSKALKSFIYAAVWIFIVLFAWAAVSLVSWLNL